jgi:pimeloyl-ACP methyl ester carboxylesterase
MLLPRLPLAIDTRRVTSFDGTSIAYHVTPEPFAGAPWVILANGLGGTYVAWRGLIDYLKPRYRFLTWDYRGLYASQRPAPDAPSAYAIPQHVRDLQVILAAEKIEAASFIGWSMGVQVLLEAYRRHPGCAQNLVLINGTFGRPLESLSPLPGVAAMLPPLVEIARRAHALATQVTRKATGQPEAATWFKRLGLVGKSMEDAVFAELVTAFGDLDMEPFFRNLQAIGAHDAEDVLASITLPTLVITGDHDLMTPPALAQRMAREIPGAELLIVRGGTHYTVVEQPELVSLRVERFFREHGF